MTRLELVYLSSGIGGTGIHCALEVHAMCNIHAKATHRQHLRLSHRVLHLQPKQYLQEGNEHPVAAQSGKVDLGFPLILKEEV